MEKYTYAKHSNLPLDVYSVYKANPERTEKSVIATGVSFDDAKEMCNALNHYREYKSMIKEMANAFMRKCIPFIDNEDTKNELYALAAIGFEQTQ